MSTAPTFAEATEVKVIDATTYSANLQNDWCVGSVPHGGYVTSLFMRVASTHFKTVLASQNQPHTIVLHLEFLRRNQEGPATFHVRHAKLGRQTSTIHVTLVQGPDNRENVVGYITNSNLHDASSSAGSLSFATGWQLSDPTPPPARLADLARDGEDAHWIELKNKPFPRFRRVIQRVRQYVPRAGQPIDRAACDEWLRLASGERFDQESLGLVSDLWPQIIEGMRLLRGGAKRDDERPPPYWYPTLVLNLEVKRALPVEGVEWLFARVRAKRIEGGRQDLEVVILDEGGGLVAVSHHVALVLSAERNLAGRKEKGKGESESESESESKI